MFTSNDRRAFFARLTSLGDATAFAGSRLLQAQPPKPAQGGMGQMDMQRNPGTPPAVTDTSITVEMVKKTKVTVIVDTTTTYSHTDMKASVKDLKWETAW